jgi:hypothetical protein
VDSILSSMPPEVEVAISHARTALGCCFFTIAVSNLAAVRQNVRAGHRPDTETGDSPQSEASVIGLS